MSARGPIATLIAGSERISLAKSPCRWTSTDDLGELTREFTGFGASTILLGSTADSVQRKLVSATRRFTRPALQRQPWSNPLAGMRRPTATFSARAAKTKLKSAKLRKLRRAAGAKKFRTARFWGSNLWPTLEFGTPAYGLSDTALHKARTTAAATVQSTFGQCTFSTILMGFGPYKDPEFLALRSSIAFWLNFWAHAGPVLKRRLTVAWVRIRAKLLEQPKHRLWMSVRGPIATLIAGLERISFTTKSPCRWTSTDDLGELTHEFTGIGASIFFLGSITDAVQRKLREPIAKHWSGTGAQHGPLFHDLRRSWRWLLKQEKYEQAARLLCISTGATWPMLRRFQFGLPDHGPWRRYLSQVWKGSGKRLASLLAVRKQSNVG